MNQMSKLDALYSTSGDGDADQRHVINCLSLYGDALLQRGGEVWLGSVAALLEGLGFGERCPYPRYFASIKKSGSMSSVSAGAASIA